MTKKELRKQYLQKRKDLRENEKAMLDDLLLIRFQQVEIPFLQILFTYWPIKEYKEPDTHLFTDFLELGNPGLCVAYPKTNAVTNEMFAVKTDETTVFIRNSFNVPEPDGNIYINPTDIDLVIVPLLAFDNKGYRAGYGKGFYDRFLAGCRKNCLKVGFSYFEPVDEISDKNDFDVPLDLCITPQFTYVF
jgi:5-formyltetrahydrofolate cyclo-ligase